MSFLGLNLTFERSNFGLEFPNVMHGRLVFLRLVNLGLDIRNLLFNGRQYITPSAARPTLWVGAGFFNPMCQELS